jgi:hypothetical protein
MGEPLRRLDRPLARLASSALAAGSGGDDTGSVALCGTGGGGRCFSFPSLRHQDFQKIAKFQKTLS